MQTGAQEPSPAPTLVRLLAGLLDAPAQAVPPLPETLGQWIDWPRAVALSRALDAADTGAGVNHEGLAALVQTCAQARARLRAAILDEQVWAAAAPLATADSIAAFAPLRQWYQGLQRKLLMSSGQLRGALRELLAQAGGESVRLAELDAVMEAVLSPREQGLLAGLPALLERRFEVLVQGGGDARGFRHGVRELLLAELELRFLPIDGLLAALSSPDARV